MKASLANYPSLLLRENPKAKQLARKGFLSFVVSLIAVGLVTLGSISIAQETIRLGISARVPNINEDLIQNSIKALKKHFGEDRVRVTDYSLKGLEDAIRNGEVDLFVSSSGLYRRMLSEGPRDLVALASPRFPDPNRSEGTTFIVKAGRKDLQKISDLKGKVLAANAPIAFSGYQLGLHEIFNRGYDPETFFSKTIFTGENDKMEEVLDEVASGQADVGFLRLCYLEDMAPLAGYQPGTFRVIEDQKSGIACSHSTSLYPSWVFSVTPSISPENAKEALQVLLAVPPNPKGAYWGIASDFHKVDALYKDLKLGPWTYLRKRTLEQFIQENWPYLMLFVVLVLGMILHSIRAERLVRRKASELEAAHATQTKLLQDASEAKNRMEKLQKVWTIGQMSSIISHELRVPIATVQMYSRGLLRILEGNKEGNAKTNEQIASAVKLIHNQTEKMEQTIERVRSYAKQNNRQRTVVDVAEIARKAIKNFKLTKDGKVPVEEYIASDLKIFSDPVELELMIVNLLRNASEAQGPSSEPIKVTASSTGDQICIDVEDKGPTLSDKDYSRLSTPLSSSKTQGMGMGLAIVRSIAEAHQGKITFQRLSPRGLKASLCFPKADDKKETGTENGS